MKGLVYLFSFLICGILGYDWTQAEAVLKNGITDNGYPGCVAFVANKDGIIYQKAFGNYTYKIAPPYSNNVNPPMKNGTIFDLASCSKVTATNTAAMQFYQRGELALHWKVSDILGDEFAVNGKGNIIILNLLLHNSGLYPDPVPFWNTPAFACPQTSEHNPPLNFDCSERIYESVLTQSLQHPINSTYVYSDLNFITLMYIVGDLAESLGYVSPSDLREYCQGANGAGGRKQCYFEAYVRKYIIDEIGLTNTGFRLEE